GLALPGDRSHHCVETGAVTAAREHCHAHTSILFTVRGPWESRAFCPLPSRRMAVVIAIDAGTTGVRCLALREDATPAGYAYAEFPQHFPAPGLVEHDPRDIWRSVTGTLAELVAKLDGEPVAAIGITDQRETTVVWDRRTGEPLHNAIVWQDRRT